MREAVASAPGKVNLILRSGAKGEDGFHPLFSVFEAISLREYVVARTRRKPGVGVTTKVYRPSMLGEGAPAFDQELTQKMAELPEEQHLAHRAARALQPLAATTQWGANSSGVELTVYKCIPIAGGMAGGSADAAATLVAVNELWQLGLEPAQLEMVGRQLGADVPACLRGEWSMGIERGDHLTSLANDGSTRHWWALAFVEGGLSTPAVFREFDELGLGETNLPTELSGADLDITAASAVAAGLLRNDLAEASLSLRPELAAVGESSLQAGAVGWMVSGSGPTIAALAPDRETASEVCQRWVDQGLADSAAVVWGPGKGAQIEEALPGWV